MSTAVSKKSKLSKDEAAASISRIIEEHMQEQGWSEQEKDRRTALSSTRIQKAVKKHSQFERAVEKL